MRNKKTSTGSSLRELGGDGTDHVVPPQLAGDIEALLDSTPEEVALIALGDYGPEAREMLLTTMRVGILTQKQRDLIVDAMSSAAASMKPEVVQSIARSSRMWDVVNSATKDVKAKAAKALNPLRLDRIV